MTAQNDYCEICKKQYANIAQHKNTKRHKEMIEAENRTAEGITLVHDDDENTPDPEPEPEPEQANTKIQIIDGEPKKEKSAINEIMEVAFSEQFAPITMSLLNAAVERLQGSHNPERKKGNMIQTQAGEEIEDF